MFPCMLSQKISGSIIQYVSTIAEKPLSRKSVTYPHDEIEQSRFDKNFKDFYDCFRKRQRWRRGFCGIDFRFAELVWTPIFVVNFLERGVLSGMYQILYPIIEVATTFVTMNGNTIPVAYGVSARETTFRPLNISITTVPAWIVCYKTFFWIWRQMIYLWSPEIGLPVKCDTLYLQEPMPSIRSLHRWASTLNYA